MGHKMWYIPWFAGNVQPEYTWTAAQAQAGQHHDMLGFKLCKHVRHMPPMPDRNMMEQLANVVGLREGKLP